MFAIFFDDLAPTSPRSLGHTLSRSSIGYKDIPVVGCALSRSPLSPRPRATFVPASRTSRLFLISVRFGEARTIYSENPEFYSLRNTLLRQSCHVLLLELTCFALEPPYNRRYLFRGFFPANGVPLNVFPVPFSGLMKFRSWHELLSRTARPTLQSSASTDEVTLV